MSQRPNFRDPIPPSLAELVANEVLLDRFALAVAAVYGLNYIEAIEVIIGAYDRGTIEKVIVDCAEERKWVADRDLSEEFQGTFGTARTGLAKVSAGEEVLTEDEIRRRFGGGAA